ncbi:SPOR domain-containing protein [Flavisolibacter nicotianae]|uniref:SPOR domain-containing protein n=1 Tax=Flavisolibacter nicotianae TaxID=2364882 RepID=UPI000EAC6AF4|nr:SPOR domain-containing protein [Flavisolibacter nicotianae]
MKKLALVIALFVLKTSFAQDSVLLTGPAVIVHSDPRADMLAKKQAEINERSRKITGRTMRGYRLLVLNTNNRDEAIAAKTKIYTHFPEQKAYLTYQSPFFKLKAGNFKTRDEAKRYQSLMNTMFPKGVFIVSDIIEVAPVKDPDEQE